MNSEQNFKTGYGLVKAPGSIVTNVGQSQRVDPGWSKSNFDQKHVFFLVVQAKQGLRHPPHEDDTLANQKLDN